MYLIKWHDHFSTDGFFDKELTGMDTLMELTSLGFYLKEDENYYHFARTIGKDTIGDVMSILKDQTVEITELFI